MMMMILDGVETLKATMKKDKEDLKLDIKRGLEHLEERERKCNEQVVQRVQVQVAQATSDCR